MSPYYHLCAGSSAAREEQSVPEESLHGTEAGHGHLQRGEDQQRGAGAGQGQGGRQHGHHGRSELEPLGQRLPQSLLPGDVIVYLSVGDFVLISEISKVLLSSSFLGAGLSEPEDAEAGHVRLQPGREGRRGEVQSGAALQPRDRSQVRGGILCRPAVLLLRLRAGPHVDGAEHPDGATTEVSPGHPHPVTAQGEAQAKEVVLADCWTGRREAARSLQWRHIQLS